MACINRILCFAVTVIIAQCSVKLTERNPASLTCKSASFSRCIICTIIIISIISIQFIVCIIVIQCAGYILGICFFFECCLTNIYNIRQFLAFFGITRGTFFSPVASAVAAKKHGSERSAGMSIMAVPSPLSAAFSFSTAQEAKRIFV